MKTDSFHFDLILKAGFLVTLGVVGINLAWYLAGWDFYSLAGLFKIMIGTLFFPLIGFIIALYALMKRQGKAGFLQLLVHCLLISASLAAGVTAYWAVFYLLIEPDYYYQVLRVSYEGLLESARQVETIKVKTDILEQAALYKRQLDDPQSFNLSRLLINEMVRYLLIGLIFGSVLGFILSKIRVMRTNESPT
jgi:hypothetical protein